MKSVPISHESLKELKIAGYWVNFILAAGLHSYGFSSGGAYAIAVFVISQIAIIAASLLRKKFIKAMSS